MSRDVIVLKHASHRVDTTQPDIFKEKAQVQGPIPIKVSTPCDNLQMCKRVP